MVSKKASQNLIKTGINGLDEIFLGGIKTGNIILIEGAPGSGKTTFGLEFLYRGAKEFKENGLLISFEATPERLYRDALSYGWDFESLKEKKRTVKIIHLSPAMLFQDLLSTDSIVISEIKKINAKRVVIDGVTPLKLFSGHSDPAQFRAELYRLVQSLQSLDVSTLFTRELPEFEGPMVLSNDEQFICDTVITLSHRMSKRRLRRSLEIKKSRGQEFIDGKHTLHFNSGNGLQIFRRSQSREIDLFQHTSSHERVSTGIKTLDPVIGGGVFVGSVTLAVGISGTGKTVMGMQFLDEAVKLKQKALLVTLDEPYSQILRNSKTLGIDLEEHVKNNDLIIHCESPLDIEMDVHFDRLVKIIEEHDIKRVVLDSVIAYRNSNPQEAQMFIYALASYLKGHGITALFNYESPELLGLSQISEELKASAIVDNIILMNYVEISTQMRRAITVPKARGSAIPQRTREFIIDEGGIRLVDEKVPEEIEEVPQLPFSSYYGVLSRAPARHSPMIESKILNGEELPESTNAN